MSEINTLFEGNEPVNVRIRQILAREGIQDIDGLARLTEDDILRIPNFSRKSLYRIKSVLDAKGRSLSSSKPRTITTSKVIDAAWRSILETNRVPPETHPDLVKTYKRFFYAGAKVMLDSFVYCDLLEESDDVVATTQDINRIDAIMHEINAFFTEVAAGRQ